MCCVVCNKPLLHDNVRLVGLRLGVPRGLENESQSSSLLIKLNLTLLFLN